MPHNPILAIKHDGTVRLEGNCGSEELFSVALVRRSSLADRFDLQLNV